METYVFDLSKKGLPLNSERQIYDSPDNILIRSLTIKSDDTLWSKQADWEPASLAKWHFEECRIEPRSLSMGNIYCPWSGDFRFYKNEFFFGDSEGRRAWIFVFQRNSRVLFQKNNFGNSIIQIRCEGSKNDSDSRDSGLGNLSFLGNKGIDRLELMCNADSYVFRGTNRLNFLSFSELNSNPPALDTKI